VDIGKGVTSIGRFAFFECGLTTIVVPDNVISIGECAFQYCPSLTSVTIGSGVTSIEIDTFNHCPALKWVVVGKGVESIISYAFGSCPSLTSITFLGQTAPSIDPEWLRSFIFYSQNGDTDDHVYTSTENLTIYYIPEATGFSTPIWNGIAAYPLSVLSVPHISSAVPGDAQVTLSWEALKETGNVTIEYYVIYQDGTDVGHVNSTSASNYSMTIVGLTNGSSHRYVIAAHTSIGIETLSSSTTVSFGGSDGLSWWMPVTIIVAAIAIIAAPIVYLRRKR